MFYSIQLPAACRSLARVISIAAQQQCQTFLDEFVGRHHFSCSKSLRCHYSVLLTQTKSLILLLCLISFSRTLNAFQLQDLTKSVAPSVNLNILDYPNSFRKKSISLILLVNLSLVDFLTTSKD